jgi:flagellar protein FlaJ
MEPRVGLTFRGEQFGLVALITIAGMSGVLAGVFSLLESGGSIVQISGIVGITSFCIVAAWARDAQMLPILHRRERQHGASRTALDWQVLRVSALLLNLLLILALVLVVLQVSAFSGASAVAQTTVLVSMAMILNSVIPIALAFTIFQSLRTEYGIPKSSYRTILGSLLVSAAAILGLSPLTELVGEANPYLILSGLAVVAAATYVWRDLPNVYTLATEEKGAYASGVRLTRTQSAIIPTLIAFGLLFVVLLLFMVFGASASGNLRDIIVQPGFAAMIIIMLLAIIGSVAAVVLLGRANVNTKVELFSEAPDSTLTTKRSILYTSLGVAALLAMLAAAIGLDTSLFNVPQHRWIDFLAIAMMMAVGPYGFYAAHEHARIRRLEERFPDFLRDIASSHRGGLTLPSAVAIAARGEYGPLSAEVQRMADQMSWNVPFGEALQNFAERVATPLVQRTVSLVQEADRSGGSTSEVLLAAARDARQLKNMENDRRLSMAMYGVIIYITFGVFLLVAAVLHRQFVPQIIASSVAIEAAGNPGGFAISVVSIEEYRAFYFLASLVQGIGGGMVAGMMANGRAILGLRHAFIMAFIAYVTFALFLV